MSGWADLVNKNLDELVDEKEGYKLYPNAKFPFTKERAEEFAKVGLEQLIDDPYFLNQKWNGEQGVWPKIKEILLEFEQVRKSRMINTFLFTSGIGGGKCSKYNSLCITNRGILTAEEVYNDNSVTQMVSETGLKPIENKLEEGELEGVELTYNNGITSTTTRHHRLRVWTEEAKIEWKYVNDINIGDYVIFTPNTNNIWGTRTEIDGIELTEARCEVLGLWIAEGRKSSTNVIEIISGEEKEELDKLFKKAKINFRHKRITTNAHHYNIYDDFGEMVNKYFKSGSENKEIPQFIREMPKKLICAFLRGMFAGDGSFMVDKKNGRGTITYSTISKKLLEQTCVLLTYLNIKFSVRIDNRPNRENYKTCYNIVLRSNRERIKFRDTIGTFFERRIKALNECIFKEIREKSRLDAIPFADKTGIDFDAIPLIYRRHSYKNRAKHQDVFEKMTRGFINPKNIEFLLNEPYDILPDILKYIYNQEYWMVQVIDKKQVKERMYDFTIKDDPSYIANGVINHNTVTSNILLYWQWFEIITLPSIASYYGLMEGKITAFCILSKDADAAKKVTFMDLLPVFTNSAFVKDYFPPHIELEKLGNNPSRFPRELRFPKNITIFPGTGQAASALGFNIRGASMDEVNDMAWVESSTKARMKQYYSAAEESYREITERMNSRFPWETLHRQGKKHGFITCIGQARFPDSFTEKKILEAQILGNESTTYWVRVPRWELQPKERLSRETFIIDKTNKRVIDFLTIDRYPDLLTQRCPVCKGFLAKGAYVGNNGMLVCDLDCYKETYFSKIIVEKEKA